MSPVLRTPSPHLADCRARCGLITLGPSPRLTSLEFGAVPKPGVPSPRPSPAWQQTPPLLGLQQEPLLLTTPGRDHILVLYSPAPPAASGSLGEAGGMVPASPIVSPARGKHPPWAGPLRTGVLRPVLPFLSAQARPPSGSPRWTGGCLGLPAQSSEFLGLLGPAGPSGTCICISTCPHPGSPLPSAPLFYYLW